MTTKFPCIFLLLLLTALPAKSQMLLDVSADGRADSGYAVAWDPSVDRVIAARDVSVSNVPVARFLNSNGKGVAVYPLNDISGATYIDTWGAAGTPDGGLLLAAVVGYGPRGLFGGG